MSNEITIGIIGIIIAVLSFFSFFAKMTEVIANKSSRNSSVELVGFIIGNILIFLVFMLPAESFIWGN